MLEIDLLGPVRVSVAGHPVPVKGRLGRTVLAALALEPGRTVSVERLIDALWGESPPATARQQVHIQISKLRASLARAGAADVIGTEADGYRLRTARIDLGEVVDAQTVARADGPRETTVTTLRAALKLWRGVPLSGTSPHLASLQRPRLDELRLSLLEDCLDAELACGHAAQVVPELTELVRAHPLREGLHHRRMLALHRCGRRADALDAFRQARQVLRDELGVDPPRELIELEQEILAADPAPSHRPGREAPAQLPPRTRGFAGREAELAVLGDVLSGPATEPRLLLLTGMPGVGKTALAVHAANAALDAFPDGQLYADLRGAGPRRAQPKEVLGGFLRALGVPARSMPADIAGRTAEFRSRTVRRRLLILLDNAATAGQIEPLLTAEAGCATLVTSRAVLPELESAVRVPVGPLPDDMARDVVANVAGAHRMTDAAAIATIVKACAGLPLALRLAAGNLAAFPSLSAAEMARRLADAPGRMRTFTAGHRSVRGSLNTAVHLLEPQARQALLAVAAVDWPDFPGWVLAPALDTTLTRAGELIARLASMHLIEPAGPGPDGVMRYRTHDLVRAYCRTIDPDLAPAALDRLVSWAATLSAAVCREITHWPLSYAVVTEAAGNLDLDIRERLAPEPLRWVGADVGVLLAIAELALDRGQARAAGALLLVLWAPMVRLDLLDPLARLAPRLAAIAGPDVTVRVSAALVTAVVRLHRGRYSDVPRVLAPVRPMLSDVDAELRGNVLSKLGDAAERCCDAPEALVTLDEAVACYEACDNVAGLASCHSSLSTLYRDQLGDPETALRHAQQALRHAESLGEWKITAQAKVSIVHTSLAAGDLPSALRHAAEALVLAERHGDPIGRTWCLILNAQALRESGDLTAARSFADRALPLARQTRRPDAEAAIHIEYARIDRAAGLPAAALRQARTALELAGKYDSPVERGRIERLLIELATE
ncbi:BTAD domain-containing putative transcriptional regulator [Kutzneria sp. NPDC052558]|uniref:AfsR/SARP family transcriptional regulator n=1 Tax=Kutzneria sp. NPDC052558 TaxID=3364121 RepID=UPI0037C786B2